MSDKKTDIEKLQEELQKRMDEFMLTFGEDLSNNLDENFKIPLDIRPTQTRIDRLEQRLSDVKSNVKWISIVLVMLIASLIISSGVAMFKLILGAN